MKPFYDILEVNNYWFATYHTHPKEKLEMTESTYNSCYLYNSGLLEIVEIQIDNILILPDKNFASNEKKIIKVAKLIIKDCKYLTLTQLVKFNRTQIKLNSNGIVLIKKSHIGSILLVISYDVDSTSSREIIKKKLLPKK